MLCKRYNESAENSLFAENTRWREKKAAAASASPTIVYIRAICFYFSLFIQSQLHALLALSLIYYSNFYFRFVNYSGILSWTK